MKKKKLLYICTHHLSKNIKIQNTNIILKDYKDFLLFLVFLAISNQMILFYEDNSIIKNNKKLILILFIFKT